MNDTTIIDIVKELQSEPCFQDSDWHDCCKACGDKQQNFAAIASALLIAVEFMDELIDNPPPHLHQAIARAEHARLRIRSHPSS